MDTKIIGDKIARARKEKNMSQAQLAQHIFISPQAVGKWERGESMPDITTFSRLADILDVDLNYFSEKTSHTIGETSQAESPVKINLTAIDLHGSDFANVILHKGKFKAATLRGADFTNADLTGSSFDATDAREARFDGADLTDCHFSVTDLSGASFHKSILTRTVLSMSGTSARFADITFNDVTVSKTDLRKAVFENCVFNGIDFSYCDLRGISFDDQTFNGVKFEKSALNEVSFKGATLRNVSISVPFSLTNKSYMALKTINFDGAKMDKLTYAALQGLRAVDLSNVTIL